MTVRRLFIPILLLGAFLTACGDGGSKTPPGVGEIKLNSAFKAEFALVSQQGQAVTDDDYDGKPMLIYYGFTTCPEVCPAALGKMTAALDRLGDDADKIQPLFITVDPVRDTPERLADHLAYDPRIIGLTGTPEQAKAARDAMNVFAQQVPLPDSALEYTMDHQDMIYLTDASGTPVLALRNNVTPERIAKLLGGLIEE